MTPENLAKRLVELLVSWKNRLAYLYGLIMGHEI